jgi:endonuclease/exonuclease/phosphatase family metal-dependent hydrolase
MPDRIVQGGYVDRRYDSGQTGRIRILNWNIEGGRKLPGVMDVIRREQPDVCIFQEVDRFARRTGRQHVADVLASHFEFNYVFGVAFEELSQGSKTAPAFQGQAVLARCPITSPRILRFRRQSDVWHPRWYLPQWPVFQPRYGGRIALVAELALRGVRLVIYNLHLESHGQDDLRLWQLSEAVYDSFRYSLRTPVIIAGDLNTRNEPSPLEAYLLASGFRNAYEGYLRRGTKPGGHTLDWIFVRGPAICSGTRVHRDVRASDHYPLSTNVTLLGS